MQHQPEQKQHAPEESNKRKRTESKTCSNLKCDNKKSRKRRPIRPSKYNRYKDFMQKNGYDLCHLQEFEVHCLNDCNDKDQMPWGRHKGCNIMDLWTNLIDGGKSYLLWLYKQEIEHVQLKRKLEELRQAEIARIGVDPLVKLD